jgi:hypothetical protein
MSKNICTDCCKEEEYEDPPYKESKLLCMDCIEKRLNPKK